jgi:hypothetical protein
MTTVEARRFVGTARPAATATLRDLALIALAAILILELLPAALRAAG